MAVKSEHSCKFTKTCQALDQLYPPHLKSSKIKRAFREFFLISEKNGRKCFTPQGMSGYIAEKEKQLRAPVFLIHPYSKFREVWEIFQIIEICLGFFIRLLVSTNCSEGLWMMATYQIPALFADLFETIDVFMLFLVGFLDKETGNIVFDFRKIFFHRILDLYLVINVLASLPIEFLLYVYYICIMKSTFIGIVKNFAFLKIIKFYTCTKYLSHVAKIYNWKESTAVFVWGVLFNLFVCHWFTCTYHEISTYKKHADLSDVNFTKNAVDGGFFLHYSKIFYTISCTLLDKNVVLRNVSNYTFEDNFFWYFAITSLYFCGIITMGLIIHYVGLLRNSEVFYEEMKQEVQKFLVQENLPKHIHKKVMKYLQFRYKNTYFVEELIWDALSPPLRREVKSFLCMDLLLNPKSIFKDISSDFATELCMLMTYEVFLPGDVIFRAGDKPSAMYFLYSGSVAVYSGLGKEVMHWYEGQQFGVSSFIPNLVHPVTVLALEMSECYVLRYKDFLKLTTDGSEYFKAITKAAFERRKYVLGLYSEDE